MTVCQQSPLSGTYAIKLYRASPPWDAAPDVLLSTTSVYTSYLLSIDLQPTAGENYYTIEISGVVYVFHVPSSGGPYVILDDLVDTENRDLIVPGYYDLSIGTVTSLDTGAAASASISGAFPSQSLNLGLPAGAKGDKGDTGADGTDGTDGEGVPSGGTAGQSLKKKSGTDYDTEWETGTPIGPLASVLYEGVSGNYASGAIGPVDSTGFAKGPLLMQDSGSFDPPAPMDVTFTAPASGKVKITLSALVSFSLSSYGAYWYLRDSVSAEQQGPAVSIMTSSRNDYESNGKYTTTPLIVDGLTSGTSYTFRWCAAISAAANDASASISVTVCDGASVTNGFRNPPGVMIVEAM